MTDMLEPGSCSTTELYPNLNTDLLTRVAAHIESNWNELELSEWGNEPDEVQPRVDEPALKYSLWNWIFNRDAIIEQIITFAKSVGAKEGDVGKRGCISLHVVKLGGGDVFHNLPAQAQRLLGIDLTGITKLVFTYRWPDPYKEEWEDLEEEDCKQTRAWIAAERIRHFIQTKGTE